MAGLNQDSPPGIDVEFLKAAAIVFGEMIPASEECTRRSSDYPKSTVAPSNLLQSLTNVSTSIRDSKILINWKALELQLV
jgi:hypothetical protein